MPGCQCKRMGRIKFAAVGHPALGTAQTVDDRHRTVGNGIPDCAQHVFAHDRVKAADRPCGAGNRRAARLAQHHLIPIDKKGLTAGKGRVILYTNICSPIEITGIWRTKR